jgi:predicted MarR family transcription regulator
MEAIRSSETSVQSTTSTRRHTPEDGILHSHRRENLKSYTEKVGQAVMLRTRTPGVSVFEYRLVTDYPEWDFSPFSPGPPDGFMHN